MRYTSAPERRARLVEMVEEQGFCTTTELAEALGVSDMTIRRDVQKLTGSGQLRSVYGGVSFLPQHALEGSRFATRSLAQGIEKRLIAQRALDLIEPGEALALDSGTTTWEVARAWPRDLPATVVTNSLPAMAELVQHHEVQVVGLGGNLQHDGQAFAGPATIAGLADVRVNTFFLAASGLADSGVYTGNALDQATKRALLAVADRVILLADTTKLSTVAMVRVCPLDAVDQVIIDDALTDAQRELFEHHGVQVDVVGTGPRAAAPARSPQP